MEKRLFTLHHRPLILTRLFLGSSTSLENGIFASRLFPPCQTVPPTTFSNGHFKLFKFFSSEIFNSFHNPTSSSIKSICLEQFKQSPTAAARIIQLPSIHPFLLIVDVARHEKIKPNKSLGGKGSVFIVEYRGPVYDALLPSEHVRNSAFHFSDLLVKQKSS